MPTEYERTVVCLIVEPIELHTEAISKRQVCSMYSNKYHICIMEKFRHYFFLMCTIIYFLKFYCHIAPIRVILLFHNREHWSLQNINLLRIMEKLYTYSYCFIGCNNIPFFNEKNLKEQETVRAFVQKQTNKQSPAKKKKTKHHLSPQPSIINVSPDKYKAKNTA